MPTDDPGNLPKRMAEAIVSHEWTDFPRSAHNQHNYYAECAVCQRDVPRITEVAMSVRDELVAHLSARAAEAEAKVEHAEAGAQLSSERLAKVQQELAETEGNVEAWTNTASGWQARAEQAEAAIERVRRLQKLTIVASCRVQAIEQAHDTLTVLDGPQRPETTTTPARETA